MSLNIENKQNINPYNQDLINGSALSEPQVVVFQEPTNGIEHISYTNREKVTEAVAKQRLLRAFHRLHNHFGLVNLLKKDFEVIREFTHPELKLLIKKLEKLINSNILSKNKTLIKTIIDKLHLLSYLRQFSECHKFSIIVFASTGEFNADKAKLPTFTLTEDTQIIDDFKKEKGLLFTEDCFDQYHKSPKIIPTKEQLDLFVKEIYSSDIFVWEYTLTGCFQRAKLAIQFLILMGVPKENLFMQYMRFPHRYNKLDWIYHIAPLIKLTDDTHLIIDHFFSKTKTLTSEEWFNEIKTQIDVTICHIKNEELLNYSHDNERCFTFILPHDKEFILKNSSIQIIDYPEQDLVKIGTIFSAFKISLEEQLISKLTDRLSSLNK